MRILGINHSHDAGAAIIEDGRIVAAVNEERLNRVKLFWGFPVLSIREVLRLSPGDIDYVAVSNLTPGAGIGQLYHEYNLRRRIMSYMAYFPFLFGGSIFSGVYKAFYSLFRSKSGLGSVLKKRFGINAPVRFVEHHEAHAASAFYTSPFDKDTLVVTTDGAGDGICASVSIVGHDFQLKRVASTPFFHSPASIYGYTTYNLGYAPNKDEGKLTGLAAHGRAEKAIEIFRDIVSVRGLQYNVSLYPPWGYRAVQKLHMLLWHARRDDVAAALQKRSEEVAVSFVQNCLKKYPRSNIALAGGFFANVRINQAVAEIPAVKKIFIHPHMGDGGLAAGAAYSVWSEQLLDKGLSPNPVFHNTMYFGPEFSDDEIESALKEGGLKFRHVKDIEHEAAELVRKGKVVGRFNGKMEYGPRALGNRSIIASPTDKSINDWLNKKLHRCYDDQTEILTLEGWKYMKDLSKKEIVATLNPKLNELEFQRVTKYVSYDFNGEMFSIKNKRIDLVVTPNHNMWVKKKHGTNFEFMKIDDVAKIKTCHYQKKGSIEWNGKSQKQFVFGNNKIAMDIWLEFLGYYLSEGSYYNDGYGHYRVSIAQSKKSKNYKVIEDCLTRSGFKFHYDHKEFLILKKELFDYLKQFGKAKDKFISEEILKLDQRQLRILFDALMKGDGNIRGSGYRYATTSKKLADNVSELALKLGFSSYVSKQKKSINPDHNQLYMVRIGRSPVATIKANQIKKVVYSGKVYCVTVPNHIIFVRRNGKSVFCGNTEFMPFAPSMMREHAEEYFNNFEKGEFAANFMTMTFDCTKECARNAPAITHIDNTARPQTVTKEQNPSYYRLLTIYKELTGLPIFVNTSFNEHEHPIVCSPRDAVESFRQGNIDALAIGNYLVQAKK